MERGGQSAGAATSGLGVETRQLRASLEQKLFGAADQAKVGRYELIEAIGRGGMGTVFRARDPSLSREIAVKVLGGADIGSDRSTLIARLVREAKLLAQLNHPNVVAIHDVGEQDGDVFIAMEYVRGQTLRAWLDAHPPGTRRRLTTGIDLVLEAGRGLAAAHAIGLVHRDFKPDNVLVGDDGRVRVVDFGLARGELERDLDDGYEADAKATTTTGTGGLAGTPAYMAPERFEKRTAGPAVDQYALAVTLYELACGRRPFEGRTLEELVGAVTGAPLRFPERPQVPAGLRRIIERGLARDPLLRHPELSDLLAELQRLRSGRRRAAASALLGVGATGGATIAIVLSSATARGPCEGVDQAIDSVWSHGIAGEIDASFAASGRPHAREASRAVRAAVDDFATRWRGARIDACEDVLVRGEHSSDVMDRRVACLQRDLREVETLVEVWRGADAAVVDRAVRVSQRLPALEPCERVDVLVTIAPIPDDPTAREAIERVEAETARARALVSSGRLDAAAAALENLGEVAEQTGHAPTLAGYLDARALVEINRSQVAAAAATAREGFSAALRGGDDRAAARIAVQVANRKATHERDPAAALEWTDLARSLAARTGGDDVVEAQAPRIDGLAYVHLRRFDDAERELGRAVALQREAGNEALAVRATSDMAAALTEAGELERAQAMFEGTIAATRALYGPDHPDIAHDLTTLGVVHFRRGNVDEGERVLREAVAIEERVLGPEHFMLGYTLTALGINLSQRGKLDQAVPVLERAVAVRTAALGESSPMVLETQRVLATTWVRAGRKREGAELTERVLAAERASGKGGIGLAQTVGIAAIGLLLAGETGRAVELGRESVELLDADPRATVRERGGVLSRYAYILVETGDAERAVELSRRTVEVMEGGDNPAERASARFNYAKALELAGERAQARAQAEQAVAEMRQHGALTDTDVAEVEAWLREREPRRGRKPT